MTTTSSADEAARLARRAADVALCIDFDGTVAPVVDDPSAARPLAGVIDVLPALVRRFSAVALVSGRPAGYLAEHAWSPGVRYLGLYGLQEFRDGSIWIDARLTAARPAVVAAAAELRTAPAVVESEAFLEDKEFSIAVHTRRVADPQRWAAAIDSATRDIAARHELEVITGRLVWEIRPSVPSDKGDAVRRVVTESGAHCVVVIGDDLGDLPAFAAAQRIAEAGNEAVRVAVRSAESPPQLLAAADLVVDGPPGVLDFLKLLVAR